MQFGRWTWVGIFAVGGAAAALIDCVGDDPATASSTNPTDAGGDSTSSQNDGSPPGDANAPTDSGSDSGPSCVAPTSATPGVLDQTFGSSFHALANGFVPLAFAIDTTGQSYVAGKATNCVSGTSGSDYAVVRFTKDGDVDTTFNLGKPVCFDFGTGGEIAQAIAIDADGKIIFGGLAGNTAAFVAGVVRIDSTGALDTTFNTTGKLPGVYGGTGYDGDHQKFVSVNGIAFGPGNKIVLTGSDSNTGSARSAGFIVRLTNGGALDTGFNVTGIYEDTTNTGTFSHAVVDATSGAVTAVGGYGDFLNVDVVVERLTGAGVLDTTFNTTGIYSPGPLTGVGSDIAHAIVVTPSGELAVSGAFGSKNGAQGQPGIVMLDNTGKPDGTFGAGGLFLAPKSLTFDTLDLDVPLLSLCGGDFFYASRYNLPDAGGPDIGLIHVQKNGTLDNGFGTAGIGHGMQQVVNVVAIARDPISQQPIVMATNGSNQVGFFRFDL